VGGHDLGGHAHRRRLRLRRRNRERCPRRRVRGVLRPRVRGGRTGRPPVGCLHGGDSAAADPLRRRPLRLLHLPRQHVHRNQGHLDQLRVPADRAFPTDVLHLGDRAVDRHGPLVSGRRGQAVRAQGRRRNGRPSAGGFRSSGGGHREAAQTAAQHQDRDHPRGAGGLRSSRRRHRGRRAADTAQARETPTGDSRHGAAVGNGGGFRVETLASLTRTRDRDHRGRATEPATQAKHPSRRCAGRAAQTPPRHGSPRIT